MPDAFPSTHFGTSPTVLLAGEVHQRIVFGSSWRDANFGGCPDCAVSPGEVHEFPCDWEECPRCGEQFITCDCHPLVD